VELSTSISALLELKLEVLLEVKKRLEEEENQDQTLGNST